MPPFALAQLMALELAPPDMLRLAAETGCDAVGIRLLPVAPGGAAYPLMDDPALLRETRRAVADTGVAVGDLEIALLTPGIDAAGFRPFLAAGAEVGARHVLCVGADPDRARLVAAFAALCDEAAPFGLTVDLEFIPWSAVPGLDDAIDVVAAAARPNAGLLLDPLHFDRSHSRIEAIAGIPRPWLHYWQMCDGPAERPTTPEAMMHAARTARLMPGDGGIDLISLVRAMPGDLPISIEVPSEALARTMTPLQRARLAVSRTRDLLARAEHAAGDHA